MFDGFEISERLYESHHSTIYRATRTSDSTDVVLKVLSLENRSMDDMARFRMEYAITANLAVEGVTKALDILESGREIAIVFEDIGGLSLHEHLKTRGGRLALGDFLPLAVEIARAVERVHQRHCIHKDINPTNIVWAPQNNTVELIDFGISTELGREIQAVANPRVLEGTLLYMSPEQTGRMNRAMDYRTDLYSLGVTFYQMLLGRLPFESGDPMEIVYGHIARNPVPPHSVIVDIPGAISDIIMKLLSKMAEDRYKSAVGLVADLERCLEAFERGEAIAGFAVGEEGISDQFRIPERFYGREREVEVLLESFERAGNGNLEMVMVAGYSGIGKSSLVKEMYKPVVSEHGFFISGKFDQYQNDVPFAPFIEAFTRQVQYLLTESDEQLRQWKRHLVDALGDEAAVITDVIPELTLIMGEQPPVLELAGLEAQRRFQKVFLRFLDVFCTFDNPLVLFLDDLQWADPASLLLLRAIMTGSRAERKQRRLMIVGAYRDNEVSATHPLMLALDEIAARRTDRTDVQTLVLGPLSAQDTITLVSETLEAEPERVAELATLVHSRTGGNPFFLIQFLTSLYRTEQLWFDAESRQWTWDVDSRAAAVTENVAQLLAAKIDTLEEATRSLLELASCLGNQFDLHTLSIISSRRSAEVADGLWSAVVEELLVPLDPACSYARWFGSAAEDSGGRARYRFYHDRVQEAAYSRLTEEKRADIHLQAGRLLLAKLSEQELQDQLFEIVNHLNFSRQLLDKGAEQEQVGLLNLRAGRSAKQSTAYSAALEYYRNGIDLLGEEGWKKHPDAMYQLYRDGIECEFLCGNLDAANEMFRFAVQRAEQKWQKGRLFELIMRICHNTFDYERGIVLGKQGLELFSIAVPDDETEFQGVINAILEDIGQSAPDDAAIAALADLPAMSDPDMIACSGILHELWICMFMLAHPQMLFPSIKLVQLSLTYGQSPITAVGAISYAAVLSIGFQDYDKAYAFGKLAMEIKDRHHDPAYAPKVLNTFCNFINHYKNHIATNIPLYEESYRLCLQSGEVWWGSWAASFIRTGQLIKGDRLESVRATAEKYADYIAEADFAPLVEVRDAQQAVIDNLMGRAGDVRSFDSGTYSEARNVENMNAMSFKLGLCWHYIYKAFAMYLYGERDIALDAIAYSEENYPNIPFLMMYPDHFFFSTLIYLDSWETFDVSEREQFGTLVARNMEQMQDWARHCPENFGHRLLLMQAEKARVDGEQLLAMESYDKAIAAAEKHSFLHHQALANELAGRFHLNMGRTQVARGYLKEARLLYLHWGALRKVECFDEQYRSLVSSERDAHDFLTTHKTRFETTYTTAYSTMESTRRTGSLDFQSVVKASQAISGEIVIEKLLKSLMMILMENAGAQKGYLVLLEDEHLMIKARGRVDYGEMVKLLSTPVDSLEPDSTIAVSILNYVTRLQRSVVLDNAAEEGDFVQDQYILANQPKSVLCGPLTTQGRLYGLIYLENNLATGVFTPDRVEVLNLLASQAAISLQNAQLYTQLMQSEQTLRASEERFRAVFNSVNDAIFVLEYQTGQVLSVNRQACDMFGYSREEMQALMPWDFSNQASLDKEGVLRTIQLAATGEVPLYSREYTRKSGEIFTGEVSLRKAVVGDELRVLAVIRDISERLEKDRAERAKDAAELANQAKSEFLANMSHEIRTPINAITGLTYLAMQTELSPRQSDYLKKIQTSTTNLLGVINDILDFSKIEAGRLDMETVDFSLDEVLDNVANMVSAKTEEKGLEVVFRIDPDVPLSLVGDPLRLGQVLINLASNAVKFTQTGEIVISTVRIDEGDKDVHLGFSVRDTGIGMSSEQLARLFRPFTQADSTTTRKYGGTGLGLTISKYLVERMEGEIRASSEEGKGSTFTFDAHFAKQQGQEDFSRTVPDLKGRNALVVEDNATARNYFREMLEFFGFTVFVAESSQDCIDLVKSMQAPLRLDLILIDNSLPEISGVQTLRYLYEHDLLDNPVILMVSAHAPQEEMDAAHALGVNNLLTKPVNPSSLFNAVMEGLGKTEALLGGPMRKHQPEATHMRFANARVLLVEDNVINQQVAREILEKSGLTVDIAENGKEALHAVDAGEYALVFMDVQMPVMDGIAATRALRALEKFAELPIVALTAHALASEREKCIEAGMDDCLSKPLQMDKLFGLLETYLGPGVAVKVSDLREQEESETSEQGGPAPLASLPELLWLEGLDIKVGLDIVAGNMELYVALLQTFQRDFVVAHEKIVKYLGAGDIVSARRGAHSAKGVSANIGATDLMHVAGELERALYETSDVSDLLAGFEDALKIALRDVSRFLDNIDAAGKIDRQEAPESERNPAPNGVVDVSNHLRQLRRNLEKGNPDAEDQLAVLKSVLGEGVVDDELEQLEELLDLYDFERALSVAAVLEQKLTRN